MIQSFSIENFKSFRKATLPLAPLTLLIGANASVRANGVEAAILTVDKDVAVAVDRRGGFPLTGWKLRQTGSRPRSGRLRPRGKSSHPKRKGSHPGGKSSRPTGRS
jgi:predicted ATPase